MTPNLDIDVDIDVDIDLVNPSETARTVRDDMDVTQISYDDIDGATDAGVGPAAAESPPAGSPLTAGAAETARAVEEEAGVSAAAAETAAAQAEAAKKAREAAAAAAAQAKAALARPRTIVKRSRQELEQRFTCPLCNQLLNNPVTTRECVHTFCFNCFYVNPHPKRNKYFEFEQCPKCDKPLTQKHPVTKYSVGKDEVLLRLMEKFFPDHKHDVETFAQPQPKPKVGPRGGLQAAASTAAAGTTTPPPEAVSTGSACIELITLPRALKKELNDITLPQILQRFIVFDTPMLEIRYAAMYVAQMLREDGYKGVNDGDIELRSLSGEVVSLCEQKIRDLLVFPRLEASSSSAAGSIPLLKVHYRHVRGGEFGSLEDLKQL